MAWLSVYRTSTLPHQGRQILGPNLNRSESGRSAGKFASCAAARNDNTQGPPEAAALRDFDPTKWVKESSNWSRSQHLRFDPENLTGGLLSSHASDVI
jgi:hypothetical protein